MSAIALLGSIKLFIDIFEGGSSAAVKGIIASILPGSDLITLVDSVDYVFNLSGAYSGTIDIDNYFEYSANKFNFTNKTELHLALSNFDFPSLAKKKFLELNEPKFKDRDFPTF